MSRVAICIPCADEVKAGFAFDLARMVGASVANMPDADIRIFMEKNTLLPMGRHRLVGAALECEADHILWLDSDMRFPKHTLYRLLAHKQPIVAANYVTRRMPTQPVTFAGDHHGERVFTEPGVQGLEYVAAAGMGCMLVDVDVFRKIPAPWFQVGWSPESMDYVGEDVYFSRKVRDAGLQILIDHGLSQEIGHLGEWEYRHEHSLAVRELVVPAPTDGSLDVH